MSAGQTNYHQIATAILLAAAVILTGCGGGSSTTSLQPDSGVNNPVNDPDSNGDPTTPTQNPDQPANDDPFNAGLETSNAVAPADGTPSVPANFRVDLIGNDYVALNWAPSVDNGEIVEYRLYRDDGVTYTIRGDQTDQASGSQEEIDEIWQTTSFIDCNYTRFKERLHICEVNGPETGGLYSYQISAVDNEGNESALTEPLVVQLYEDAGSPVIEYEDSYLGDDFPFITDLSRPDNFIDQFQMVFSDEFDGPELDTSKWNTSLNWGHEIINGEYQYFVDTMEDPDFGYNPFEFNREFNRSTLSINATVTPPELSVAALGQPFLSGALSTRDKFGFTYGYVEGRMKVGGIPGQLSTFYLFRRWETEHSPEIDILEYLANNPFGNEDAFQNYHYRDVSYEVSRAVPSMQVPNPSGDLYSDGFHTFGVLWEPGLVVWYIDDQEVKRLSGPQIGRQQMNIVAYHVTGSSWTPPPDETANVYPLKFEIDYIRAYQRPRYIQ